MSNMANVRGVIIGVLTSSPIGAKASGHRFLRLLLDVAPQYSPEKYNNYEPLKFQFDASAIDDALKLWGSNFFWRRSKPSVSGGAFAGFPNTHDHVYIDVPMKALAMPAVLDLFGAMTNTFGIDLAYVHVGTDADILDREYYKRHTMPFGSLTTHHLREGLPDMPWAMLFGPPYVELFGRERLLATPAARVEPIGGGVYVQLTGAPADVAKKRDDYLAAQRTAKEHLDHDAFSGLSATGECRVPDFFSD